MAQPTASGKSIPLEIFDKIIFHCDEDTLRNITSRVCTRWRTVSHRTLYQVVYVDPEEDEDIYYDVHTPLCTDIGASVRNLFIINSREDTSEPNGPSILSTAFGTYRFCNFLHRLSSLELVGFGHYFLNWATVPLDVMNALAEVVRQPTVQALSAWKMDFFPADLFFGGSNIRKLAMRDVTLPVSHAYAAPLNPPQVQLDYLALHGSETIYNFTSFLLSNHGTATQWLSSLSSIELHFEEDLRQWPSSICVAQVLLDNFATSITEFVLAVNLPKAISYYPILSSPLRALANVECLKMTLATDGTLLTIRKPTYCLVLPILWNLPSPHLLKEFTFVIQLHLQIPDPDYNDYLDFFYGLQRELDRYFMSSGRWPRLKKLRLLVNLYGSGAESDKELSFAGVSFDDVFQLLASQGVSIEASISDPMVRQMTA